MVNQPKLKKTTIIAPVEDGGLNMIDIHTFHDANKSMWIKRLLEKNDMGQVKWKICLKKMLNIDTDMINRVIPNYQLRKTKTYFHKQILE